MAVVSVNEDFKGRRGSYSEGGAREYTRVFLVVTDDASDGPVTILNANGIPRPYESYASGNDVDLGVFCKSIDPEQDSASRLFWRVTCRYDAKIDQRGNNARENPDPRQRPAEISWTSTTYTEVVTEDQDGAAIKNSANDTFIDPLTREASRPTVTVTVNRDTFNPQTKYDYEGAINNDYFLGAEPKSFICRRIDANLEYVTLENIGLVPYWRITYVFEHNRDLWNPVRVLDAGFNYLDGTDKVRIHDVNGEPVTNAIRLDGSGGVLPEPNDDEFLEFNIYPEQSFGSLNLL